MGVVTQLTGLSAHTLRAWERRYGVVEPARTERGHRLYFDADVAHLRLLHRLTFQGRRIGQIADPPTGEPRSLLREDREAASTAPGDEAESAPAGIRVLRGSEAFPAREIRPGSRRWT